MASNVAPASGIFHFPAAVRRDPAITAWFAKGELCGFTKPWFDAMRGCGDDVRELLHDGHPIACLGDAAFAYVDAFKAHVNIGFFRGVDLDDPAGLLEGAGKRMRHVKLRWGSPIDEKKLRNLIEAAYRDMHKRLKS